LSRTADYYDSAVYVDDDLLRGTGVIGLIAGDQLHPPMVDDAAIWSDSKRWREGAEESVRRLLRNAGITTNSLVLDIGCGVGGTTRMLSREFAAAPIGVNISIEQLRTARRLDAAQSYVKAGAERLPFGAETVDCVLSVNMFYHVADKPAALREMLRVTRPGGALAFDDWVVTDRATAEDRSRLLEHWNPEPIPWITDVELEELMRAVGYRIERLDDYSHVGRGVMAELFAPTFEREVRPLIMNADQLHGEMVADHLHAAIDHTIRLYQQDKLRYLQIIARRP
jgi:ubiquinone/menaquinone biosynthesis C-methylase UbiE